MQDTDFIQTKKQPLTIDEEITALDNAVLFLRYRKSIEERLGRPLTLSELQTLKHEHNVLINIEKVIAGINDGTPLYDVAVEYNTDLITLKGVLNKPEVLERIDKNKQKRIKVSKAFRILLPYHYYLSNCYKRGIPFKDIYLELTQKKGVEVTYITLWRYCQRFFNSNIG